MIELILCCMRMVSRKMTSCRFYCSLVKGKLGALDGLRLVAVVIAYLVDKTFLVSFFLSRGMATLKFFIGFT